MFSMTIFICLFLLIQLTLNASASLQDYNIQEVGPPNHGMAAPYVQPQEKPALEPQANLETVQLLNNIFGIRDETKLQSNLETMIDWLKRIVTTVATPAKLQDPRFKGAKLAQFAKILQRNDDPQDGIEIAVLNTQSYLSIIQTMLQRLEKNMAPINKNSIVMEKSWNNKVLAQFIDKMIEEDDDENNEHMIIQSLRLFLRSIDKNMERLHKNFHLGQKNVEEKKKIGGTHSIFFQKIK